MKDTCDNARTGNRRTRFVCLTLIILSLASLVGSAPAATFTVTATTDLATDLSLRRAISDANANPGPDVIVFNLPPGPQVIVPLSPLPEITEAVVIDALDGIPCLATTLPAVEIDGVMAGPFANGLTVNTPQPVTIRGLAIYRFSGGAGITINASIGGRIEGNHLGTDASGHAAGLGNRTGLELNFSRDYVVGGANPCQQNVISGNLQEGVWINGPLFVPQNNLVIGNFIGVARDGWPLPNGSHGVHFFGGPTGNRVVSNVIAYNGGSGVLVLEGIDNRILKNSIYENGLLGIDISPSDSPNPNDVSDPDSGPNRQQNYPRLGALGGAGGVTSGASGTHVETFLNSEPSTPFAIHYYWSPSCDGSGYGEGRHYLGRTNAVTDVAGNALFSADFPETVPTGSVITATATHPLGSTSEFSPCATVVPSGGNIVQHDGLPHQGDGGSVPLPCSEGSFPANPCLLTIPAGTDGHSASVCIGLGRVSGWQGDLQDVLLRDFGDSFKLTLEDGTEVGTGDGTEPTPPSPPSNEILEAAKDYVIEANIPEPSLFIRALTNGSMSLQFTLVDSQDNEVYKSVAQPDALHLTLGSSNDVVDISQAGYLQLPNGERAFRLELRRPLPLAVPGVSGRFATRAIIAVLRKISPATGQSLPPPATITSARLTYRRESPTAGAPLSFRLGEELLQQFGQLHGSLSNTVLAGWNWSQGGTSDPARPTIFAGFPRDASGALTEGGVMLRLDQARYICVDLDWELGASATALFAAAGSPVVALPYFSFKIGTNHVLPPSPDAVRIQRTERDWTIAPSFGTSGTVSNRYEIYRFGANLIGWDAPATMVVQASRAPNRVAYSTSVSPTSAQGFLFKWREAAFFSVPGTPGLPGVPGGGGFFEADELRIIPLNPARPLRSFTRLDISGAGLPWLEIIGEDWRSSRVGRVMVQKVRDGVELAAPTEAGRPYQLEFTPDLQAREWQILDSFFGDGSVRTWPLREAANRPPQGFYRLGGF